MTIKPATTVAAIRFIAFAALTMASAYVAWKDIYNWGLMNKEHPQLLDNLGRLTSVWGPAYTFLLSCVAFPVGASFCLRNRKDLSLTRIIVECIYFLIVFYALSRMSDVIFYVYNPYHSGPAL